MSGDREQSEGAFRIEWHSRRNRRRAGKGKVRIHDGDGDNGYIKKTVQDLRGL